jgi:hypothetical protein
MIGGLDRDTVALGQRPKQPSTLSSPRPVLQLKTGGGGNFVTERFRN